MKTFDELASDYIECVKEMDALALRADALCDDGDRIAYYIQSSYSFVVGSDVEQDVLLNNPFDATFYGVRLDLFLSKRLTDQTGAGNSELTYRPADWTPVDDYPYPSLGQDANCTFLVRTNRGDYSSAPLAISHAFSTRHGVPVSVERNTLAQALPATAWVGGLDFHCPYPVERAQAMVVRVSPNYTKALAADGAITDQTSVPEYRVTAVLQGYKPVRAFR